MDRSLQPKKKKARAAAENRGFHVTLRERKGKPVMAQLKYGRYLISETDPSQIASLFELAQNWNKKGVKLTSRKELLERQAEAIKYVPMSDQKLPL